VTVVVMTTAVAVGDWAVGGTAAAAAWCQWRDIAAAAAAAAAAELLLCLPTCTAHTNTRSASVQSQLSVLMQHILTT
jgi:hypothetical protein